MISGAMYLNHRGAAVTHRLAARTALEIGSPRQLHASVEAARYNDRRADEIRAQLSAARKLGLRGSAGTVPAGYFADAPHGAPHGAVSGSEFRVSGPASAQSKIGNPQS